MIGSHSEALSPLCRGTGFSFFQQKDFGAAAISFCQNGGVNMNAFPSIFRWFIVFSAFFALTGQATAAESVIDGVEVQETFAPGEGKAIGSVIQVEGDVIILHEDRGRGYRAKAELPLFRGDEIRTLPDAMISIALEDGSQMTLAGDTSLVVTQSIFDPAKKARSSFIDMGLGKVRFFIRKLSNYKQSDFKVRTRTAILGVRGSDFIVRSTPRLTEVFALGNTLLDVLSLAAPDVEPALLRDFQKTRIALGELPGRAMPLPRKEAESLQRELPVSDSGMRETRGPAEKAIVLSGEALVKPDALATDSGGAVIEGLEPAVQGGAGDVSDSIYDNEDALRDDIVKENAGGATGAPEFPKRPETVEASERESVQ